MPTNDDALREACVAAARVIENDPDYTYDESYEAAISREAAIISRHVRPLLDAARADGRREDFWRFRVWRISNE